MTATIINYFQAIIKPVSYLENMKMMILVIDVTTATVLSSKLTSFSFYELEKNNMKSVT